MENKKTVKKTGKKVVRALFVCIVAIVYFIYRILED